MIGKLNKKALSCYYLKHSMKELFSLEFLSENDIDESFHQNLGIEPPGTVLQIVEIEFQSSQHFLHGVSIAII